MYADTATSVLRGNMSPKDIKVGRIYVNRGKGTTRRKVLEISKELKAPWFSSGPRPTDEPVVRYEQNGREGLIYLRSFAAWAGYELVASV